MWNHPMVYTINLKIFFSNFVHLIEKRKSENNHIKSTFDGELKNLIKISLKLTEMLEK